LSQRIPVLVGVGQHVVRDSSSSDSTSPLSLAVAACKAALDDSNSSGGKLAAAIDTLAFVRLNSDSIPTRSGPFGVYGNLPRLVAAQIGADPHDAILSVVGGQSPQQLVNEMANRINAGQSEVVLLTGSEAIGVMKAAVRAGEQLSWDDSIQGQLDDRGTGPELVAAEELAGGMGFPPQVYGAFEHAWYAQFPHARSEAFLSTPSDDNYPVADPYLKWHVAQDAVNQGAALILTHEERARELGVPQEQWVYLHGGADAQDKLVTRRPVLHASKAMQAVFAAALAQSRTSMDEVAHLELYSCFPCAVQFACDALGIDSLQRQLTQTGGLPYFGGAGNNYSMHGIASLAEKLREDPGATGLVLANGGFLSKESAGVYSTRRPEQFLPVDSTDAQASIDSEADVAQAQAPDRGTIESYSVLYQRRKPLFAYAFMRSGSERFLARTNTGDTDAVARLTG